MRSSIKKKMLTVVSVITLFIVGLSLTFNFTQAEAGAMCTGLGAGMTQDSTVQIRNITNKNNVNRKWTVEELFKDAASFTSYYGEGEETLFLSGTEDRGTRSSLWEDATVQERIKDSKVRSAGRCALGGVVNGPANFLLWAASGIAHITKWAMTAIFSDSIFGSGKGAINLVSIIGGGRVNDKGMIGMLMNSIYTPLVVIALLIVGVKVIYKGIIQMKFREALQDILWAIGAFVIGMMLMLNPDMLANAPQRATSEIGNCIIAGMNGENCLNPASGGVAESSVVGLECKSSADGLTGMEGQINGITCGIWKTFIMEPWAQAQFGVPYSDLYTKNPPAGGSIWANLPEGEGDNYCVALGTSKAASSYEGKTVTMDKGPSVCNVALYQMYLKSNVQDNVNHSGDTYKVSADYDARWYDIIAPMAKDDSNWHAWAGVGTGLSRIAAGFTALIAVGLSGALLSTLGIVGAGYKAIGIILMAFAPFFFLLAIIPGRGKDMFLGWLESVISSVLKYMAIALLAIISLTLYSSILTQATGMVSFIGVIVITSTMFAYRKEVTDMLGTANLGGKKMKNQFKNTGKNAKRFASSVAGGAIGSKLAGGTISDGAQEGALRNLKRGTSTSAQMFSQYDRTKRAVASAERAEALKRQQEADQVEATKGSGDADNTNNDNNNNNNSTPKDVEVVDKKTTEVEVEAGQRPDITDLNAEELKEYSEFLSKVESATDEELLELLDSQENPIHRQAAVANLDERIAENTSNKKRSPILSKHPLANPRNMITSDLQGNISKYRDDFINEGTNEELYHNNLGEFQRRNDISEDLIKRQTKQAREDRVLVQNGSERNRGTKEDKYTNLEVERPNVKIAPNEPKTSTGKVVEPKMPDLDEAIKPKATTSSSSAKPTQSSPKVEPRAERKEEPKVAMPELDPKVEPKASKSEPKVEPKAQSTVEPKVDPRAERKEEPKVAMPELEPKVEPKPKVKEPKVAMPDLDNRKGSDISMPDIDDFDMSEDSSDDMSVEMPEIDDLE